MTPPSCVTLSKLFNLKNFIFLIGKIQIICVEYTTHNNIILMQEPLKKFFKNTNLWLVIVYPLLVKSQFWDMDSAGVLPFYY